MELSRNKQHFVVMTVVYQILDHTVYGENKTPLDVEDLMMNICEVETKEEVPNYVRDNVYLVMQHYGEIVNAIIPNLKGWSWERIPLLSQSIILSAYAHFYYVEKIDKKVVIDVAVNLAKSYVGEKQAKFINALLDGVLK